MNPTRSRPTAVWIGLAILMAYIPLLIISMLASPSESVLDETDLADQIIEIIEFSFVVLSLTVAFWALATRRQWGRWLIALPLAYMLGTLAYGLLFLEFNPVDKEDLLIGAALGSSPLVLVIFLVSVGSKVKTYFSRLGPSDNES
ncbi:MAG: hypothetical protein IPM25_16190 [Chloracidobacterium sp.]|nr:hypothetical protein [Chloracidobacterium sp.]